MLPPENIKEYKIQLRQRYKQRRSAMRAQQKAASDARIAARLRHQGVYRRCKQLLCYVSLEIEVSTVAIIQNALQDGKRVAVPRCVPGTREMEFYYIESLEELSPGSFGVPEPAPDPARRMCDFGDSLCVVPALACDRDGYRLGYGGGYYDRFLRDYPGKKAVILYRSCVAERLWHGRFDVPVDYIVTEYFTASIAKKRGQGGSAIP